MSTTAHPDRLLTTEEAASFLSVAPRTLMQWRTNRKGPSFKKLYGHMVRYPESALIEWVDAQKTVTAQA